jgi:hypothetical protein
VQPNREHGTPVDGRECAGDRKGVGRPAGNLGAFDREGTLKIFAFPKTIYSSVILTRSNFLDTARHDKRAGSDAIVPNHAWENCLTPVLVGEAIFDVSHKWTKRDACLF